MEINQVTSAIIQALPDAQIQIEGEGCNFSVLVVSSAFQGLLPVKRQQLVLSALSEFLASGALHAISLKTLTPDEPRPEAPGELIGISQ